MARPATWTGGPLAIAPGSLAVALGPLAHADPTVALAARPVTHSGGPQGVALGALTVCAGPIVATTRHWTRTPFPSWRRVVREPCGFFLRRDAWSASLAAFSRRRRRRSADTAGWFARTEARSAPTKRRPLARTRGPLALKRGPLPRTVVPPTRARCPRTEKIGSVVRRGVPLPGFSRR